MNFTLNSVAWFNLATFLAVAYGVFDRGFSPWYFAAWLGAIFMHAAVCKTIMDGK